MTKVTSTTMLGEHRTRMYVLPLPRHWFGWTLVLVAVLLTLGLTVKTVPGITASELSIDQTVSADHSAFADIVAMVFNSVFSPAGGVFLVAAISLFILVVRKSPVSAIAVGAITATGWLSTEGVKSVIGRYRPDSALLSHPLLHESGAGSFPSGHTAAAVSLAIALILLLRGTKWQTLAMLGGLTVAILVAASRVYVGAHYPSDVVGSFLSAPAGILLFSALWNRYARRALSKMTVLGRFGPIA
ncbi:MULTISPECIES: phosphatase PAP2 family protein [unclassified Cryobacterium]|uniref:phosphatase PAP2 family protein n=1 Tax=unclassified Cryobacterium TaxID=2649013 RepID=UPI00106AB9D1|nr:MULTISPECIES: phosphatase PAP2 family protein [Cryobacterium]MEC5150592.1 undecaprenyl-diphosphatase [Cryobacterium psychrotolerans]TFC08039.1 phosphatase PAP2 family protein [Cryobacterium sp. MDB2-33-2]